MKKRALLLILVLVVATAGLLFAGGGQQQQSPAQQQGQQQQPAGPSAESTLTPVAPGLTVVDHSGGTWEAGKKGGRLVIGQLGEGPKTFNMVLSEETSTTDVTERLQSRIGRRNQFTLEYEPELAQSWSISADEKTLTVTLRPNLKWSDGTPLTARDWVDGYNKIIYNEEIQTSSRDAFTIGGELATWTYIDDRTFTIGVAEVYAGLIGNLLETAPLPMHILGPIIDSQGAGGINTLWGVDSDPREVPSSGPWVVTNHVANQRTTFGPNPNYYEKDAAGIQLPYLNELVFVYTPDQDTLLQNFLAGQSDWLVVRGADYAILNDERERLGFNIYEVGESTATNFITFNQNPIEGGDDQGISGPVLTQLSNKQFRTALAHLIDRETIINNVEFGFGYPQYSFVPRFSPYYWDGVEDAAPGYDPNRAAEILDEIGYTDRDGDGFREDAQGNPIELSLETNSGNRVREAIGTSFAQEAANVGIKINFRPIDFNVLVGKLTGSFDWHLILIGLTGSVDPIGGANVYPSYGTLHMIEPGQTSPRRAWEQQVDAAWEEANNTTNEAQRKSGYEKIQRIWVDELPWAYTYTQLVMEAYGSEYGNVYPQPTEDYDWEGVITRLYVK